VTNAGIKTIPGRFFCQDDELAATVQALIAYGLSEKTINLAQHDWMRPGEINLDSSYVNAINDALCTVHLAEQRIANPEQAHVWIYGRTPILGNIIPEGLPPLFANDKCREVGTMINGMTTQWLEQEIYRRHAARLEKDWVLADQIRKTLSQHKIEIADRSDGSINWMFDLR
jgi:cysteinyl-tRNA synthetase